MVGIYMFTNRCNGKSYIGQSVDIERRYKDHRFHTCENTVFHDDLRYYGFHNFDFCILEECCVSDLNSKEVYYIKKYNTMFPNGYNMTPGGNFPHTNKLKSASDVDAIITYLKEDKLTNGEIGKIFGISDQMVSDINCGRCWKQDDLTYPIRDGRRRKNLKTIEKCVVCGTDLLNRSKTHMCRKCYDAQRARKSKKKQQKQRSEVSKPRKCISCGGLLSGMPKTGMCKCCYNKSRRNRIPPREELEALLYSNPLESVARMYGVRGNSLRKWCDALGISRYSKDYRKNTI